MHQDATWHGGRPQPRELCVRWGPSRPLPKGRSSNFWPMSIAAKRLHGSRCHLVRRYRVGHCVRWGPSSPSPKWGRSPFPIFGLCLLWPNGWVGEDTTWHGSRPWPNPHCIRRGPSSVRKGHVYCGHGCPSRLLLSSCHY